MKKIGLAIAGLAIAGLLSGSAIAASSKFAAHVTGVLISDPMGGVSALNIPIKTANKSDLLVGISLQSSVLTETKTKGRNGDTNLSVAEGMVQVCLTVSGVDAANIAPGCVVFESRRQTLETKLSGVLTCPAFDTADVDDFCSITDDEEVNLLLETMSANHFNFVVRNVSSGNHTVSVTITATTSTSCTTFEESCRAEVAVGPGSITVEEVRATNDGNGIIFD